MNKLLLFGLCTLSAWLLSCASAPRAIDILNDQPATYRVPFPESRKDVFNISDDMQNQMVFDAKFGAKKAKMIASLTQTSATIEGIKTFEIAELNLVGEKTDILTDDITQLIRVFARAINSQTFEAYLTYASNRTTLAKIKEYQTTENLTTDQFIDMIRHQQLKKIPTILTCKAKPFNQAKFTKEYGENAIQTVQITKQHVTQNAMNVTKALEFSKNIANEANTMRHSLLTDFAVRLLKRYDIVCEEYNLIKDATISPEKSALLVERNTLIKEFELVQKIIISLEYTQVASLYIQHELSIIAQKYI